MRKEKIITLTDRDNELTFKIKEMPAMQLESWLVRAGLLFAATGAFDGAEVHDTADVMQKAGAVFGKLGVSALASIDYEKAKPLLDELLGCCYRTDAGIEQRMTPEIVDTIIEDVKTLFVLQKEAAAINLGFFSEGGLFSSDNGQKPESQEQSKQKISVRSHH